MDFITDQLTVTGKLFVCPILESEKLRFLNKLSLLWLEHNYSYFVD